jgi:hypothetical protein
MVETILSMRPVDERSDPDLAQIRSKYVVVIAVERREFLGSWLWAHEDVTASTAFAQSMRELCVFVLNSENRSPIKFCCGLGTDRTDCAAHRSRFPSPLNQADRNCHDGQNQEKVNEPAHGVGSGKTECPENQQNHRNCPKHFDTLLD